MKNCLQCCISLGLCSFLADNDLVEIGQVMLALETIFSSLPRCSENGAGQPIDTSRLHTAALSAWTLLLTLLTPRHIYDLSHT